MHNMMHIYIFLTHVFAFKYMYIWLHMAIYTYICSYLGTQEVYKTSLHSAFIPRKLVCTTPSWYSYGAAPPNFHAEGCSASSATPDTW